MTNQAPVELQRDAARTRSDILAVATDEFAANGYSGARVDEIAAKTRTTKRMIYYYFGGKEGLYTAVLEGVYAAIRSEEQNLRLGDLPPVEAMTKIVRFAFDYHGAHPELCRLVSIENIHQAQYLRASERAMALNSPVITLIAEVLERGLADGSFARRVSAMEVHLLIMAQAMYSVNHRNSIQAVFGYDMADPGNRARLRQMAVDSVLSWLRSTDEA
ncbi:TetR family transcriptional regulator [Enemella dayhoffiae]|uniref:TetR family transcriptional regulator n=1 Tax=Enemella dayhoffiae TaxID=2016507 RepID=A0A255GQC7_9ACTN|nr:TetR family transcriptional regulator [Enemella dayhoffiae]OYO16593.1 TetR family transcriptional regulator [Enemella dayhoffiae]